MFLFPVILIFSFSVILRDESPEESKGDPSLTLRMTGKRDRMTVKGAQDDSEKRMTRKGAQDDGKKKDDRILSF